MVLVAAGEPNSKPITNLIVLSTGKLSLKTCKATKPAKGTTTKRITITVITAQVGTVTSSVLSPAARSLDERMERPRDADNNKAAITGTIDPKVSIAFATHEKIPTSCSNMARCKLGIATITTDRAKEQSAGFTMGFAIAANPLQFAYTSPHLPSCGDFNISPQPSSTPTASANRTCLASGRFSRAVAATLFRMPYTKVQTTSCHTTL
mmetsp:Transcript_51106/g.136384  ORF Transcript_51106/g.136384 Transcript_51106/m.136384 type:complete len:208 (+) Transcript_51106:320-943(+)